MKHALLAAGAALIALTAPALAQSTADQPAANPGSATSPTPSPADGTVPPANSEPTTTGTTASDPAVDQPAPTTGSPDGMTSQGNVASGAASPQPAAGTPEAAAGGQTAASATSGTGAGDPAKLATAQQAVQAGWSRYDAGGKGQLTALEFGTWVLAASGNDLSGEVTRTRTSKRPNLPAVKVLNATAEAFGKADTDRNHLVSRDELTAFLSA